MMGIVLPYAGADIVTNALAWLTVMTHLADPVPLNAFKQLCIEQAAAGMDWDSSRYIVCAEEPAQASQVLSSTAFAKRMQLGTGALRGEVDSLPSTVCKAPQGAEGPCQSFCNIHQLTAREPT